MKIIKTLNSGLNAGFTIEFEKGSCIAQNDFELSYQEKITSCCYVNKKYEVKKGDIISKLPGGLFLNFNSKDHYTEHKGIPNTVENRNKIINNCK